VQWLFSYQPVRVKVRCAAACDVRAYVPSGSFIAAGVGVSARARRWRTLLLRASGFGILLPRHPGRIIVRARISAPGSAASRTLRLRVQVARHAVLPVPRLIVARAIRRGRSILVTWRTTFPARQVRFLVAPARFAVRLRPERPNAVRRLVITASDREYGHEHKVTVPVTR
jgi:hypothetical protein